MGLVKYGNGVAGISGKVSGSVFARNAAGAYVRNWAKPVNPGTSRQTDVRSSFAAGSAAFSMLTAGQVDSWYAYAKTLTRINRQGDSYTPTGRQIYIEQYNNMIGIGQTPLEVPSAYSNLPAIDTLGLVTALSSAGEVDTLEIDTIVATIPSGADGYIVVEAAPSHKPSLTNVNTQFRQIFTALTTADPFNIATGFITVFGNTLITAQTFSVRVRVVDNLSGLGSTRMLSNVPIMDA